MNPCIYLGDVLEMAVCNSCGMKGQPFEICACELHARCMTNRFRNDRPDLKVCINCDDYTSVTSGH
jgi:hypothetical protein